MKIPGESWARALAEEIRRSYPEWRVGRVSPFATGLEAAVFFADTEAVGPLALKRPLSRHIHNDNDQGIDARDLLRQDALAFEHLRRHRLPAPEVLALHFGSTFDFLAYRFVSADDSACSGETVGRLIRRLHDAPLPGFSTVAHRGSDRTEDVLANLTDARLRIVRSASTRGLPPITRESLRSALAGGTGRVSLLHMDVRAPNLLCAGGDVAALIDWSNALVADPLLEIARIAEYGDWPMPDVCRGYGRDVLEEASPRAEIAARLYTAVMLAVVFLSEAPNPERAFAAVNRVRVLLEKFEALS